MKTGPISMALGAAFAAAAMSQTLNGIRDATIDVETEGEEATQSLKRSLDEVPGTLRTHILY